MINKLFFEYKIDIAYSLAYLLGYLCYPGIPHEFKFGVIGCSVSPHTPMHVTEMLDFLEP
jgi:hypothetical protein